MSDTKTKLGDSDTALQDSDTALQDSDTALQDSDTALASGASLGERAKARGNEDSLVGESLAGRYRVEERIGRGGMGLVYAACHEALGKKVAVKVMREELAADGASIARFEREARAAASLPGDHIVDVTDYGVTERGDAFMVMELLEGQTLEQALRGSGPFEPGRAVAIARQIAKGLAAAHDGGVIHRDLKTANVFVLEREGHDHVKLLDFGISKLSEPSEEDVRLTSTGAVMGTPNYMSPEQARGGTDLDHRADLYALGVILFEMLTGDVPFAGQNFLEVAHLIISKEAPRPSELRPDGGIPEELDALVATCLAKDPGARFQNAGELVDALPAPSELPGGWSSASQLPPSVPPSSTAIPPGRRKPGRKGLGTTAAVAGALVVGGLVTYGALTWDRADEAGPAAAAVTPAAAGNAHRRGDRKVVTKRSAASVDQASAPPEGGALDAMPGSDSAEGIDSSQDSAPANTVVIEVVPTPDSAEVSVDGESLGRGMQRLERPVGETKLRIVVEASGYEPDGREVVPDESRTVEVALRRIRSGEHRAAKATGEPVEPFPAAGSTAPSGGDLRPSPYGD